MTFRPHVTVAAVVERDGRFLLVEERIDGRVVLNQPAGHVEAGESLLAAVVRETLEESAWGFEPEAVVGLYLWTEPVGKTTYLRTAFAGRCTTHHADRSLDAGIERAVWLTRAEVAESDRTRSPLVLRCIDDYLRGRKFPLDIVQNIEMP